MSGLMAAMQHLGEINGKPCFWAAPGRFTKPGFYFWDGKTNVHVPLEAMAALEFYARHDHWMQVTESAEASTLLVAGASLATADGWAMAEKALGKP